MEKYGVQTDPPKEKTAELRTCPACGSELKLSPGSAQLGFKRCSECGSTEGFEGGPRDVSK